MRIRAGTTSSEWRLFEDGNEVGYIRGSEVGFTGFSSEMDAAQAAYAAHRALTRRRAKSRWIPDPPDEFLLGERGEAQYVIERSGLLARLYEPKPDAGRAVRGEPLFDLYSPMVLTAEQELLLAKGLKGQVAGADQDARAGAASLVEAARRRLLAWDIAPADIEALSRAAKSGAP